MLEEKREAVGRMAKCIGLVSGGLYIMPRCTISFHQQAKD